MFKAHIKSGDKVNVVTITGKKYSGLKVMDVSDENITFEKNQIPLDEIAEVEVSKFS
jgi:hypothetical protein